MNPESTIALSLIAHTNVGKTTLARTLVGRDVGAVRDAQHVTEEATSYPLLTTAEGDTLVVWDTPGFGDSARLGRRLTQQGNPIGWFLSQVWDRFRDRAFFLSQQVVRNVRDQADVVLYLVNASESPEDAGYLASELSILEWIGKPVVVLINQTGRPRPRDEEQAEEAIWRAALEPRPIIRAVTTFDAFARCWVQEIGLLDLVGNVLPEARRMSWTRVVDAWQARRLAQFNEAMSALAVKSQEVVPSIQLEEADGSYAVNDYQEDRVDSHKNAPMTPAGRARMVQAVLAGEVISAVAERLAVDRKTVRKWVARYAEAGAAGLQDRSSRPRRSPTAIARGTAQRVVTLRRRRYTMATIARTLGIAKATASRVLARAGLSRLAALDPAPLPQRYERATPGELLHIDIKRLGAIRGVGHRITGQRQHRARGVGWDVTYVAIDDHSRVGFAEVWPAENAQCAAGFLQHALAYYQALGLRIERIMTDNGKVFDSRLFVAVCEHHHIKRLHTRFYRPQTNGKAERFIQTALREWAYGRTYRHSRTRTAHLPRWLHHYNWHRPHSAIGGFPPISRLKLTGDNVLSLHN